MSRAAVTLNILRKQNRTSHNMKTFEIPGMGGLMLTERSYEQNNFFPENKSSLMYTGLKELKKKILYAYNNKHVSKIRIAGSKVIKKNYYKNRVNLILDEIWKLKK
jgi:spore maturation protein CgeB